MSTRTVLIIGGYGVFGGKLAQALARDGRFDVVVAAGLFQGYRDAP